MVARSMVSTWAALAKAQPDRLAVTISDGTTVRWGELHARTNRLARQFADQGVAFGDLVTIALPTNMSAVEAIIATIKLGATPNVVSGKLPGPELSQIVELADPKLIVTDGAISINGRAQLSPPFVLEAFSDADLPEVISPVFKAPTSGGSTGRPKIILSGSPATIDDSPEAPLVRLGFPLDGCCMSPGPLYHNTACLGLLVGLSLRNHIVLEERFDPELTLALIERYRVNFTIIVPTMMNRIWRLPEETRARYDLSSLRIVQHNAGACPPDLKRAWIDWIGPDRLMENYTATEQTAVTMVTGREWLEKPGTVGRVISGEMEIRDEEGLHCPTGEIGTIWMRRPEGAPRTFNYKGQDTPEGDDRWETVGDMGHFDQDGYLFLADRRADLIISGGANIYPAEVENAISAHPRVVESVVFGIPDYDMGELAHAVISTEDGQLTKEEMDAFVRSRLAGYKCPRSYEFTAAALRDDAGKVRRAKMREAYLEKHGPAAR